MAPRPTTTRPTIPVVAAVQRIRPSHFHQCGMQELNVNEVGRCKQAGRMASKSQHDRGDIIDLLTMYPDARRRVVRALSEIDAAG